MRDVFFDTSIPIEDEETYHRLWIAYYNETRKSRKENEKRTTNETFFFCSRRGGPAHRHTHRKKL